MLPKRIDRRARSALPAFSIQQHFNGVKWPARYSLKEMLNVRFAGIHQLISCRALRRTSGPSRL